MNSMFSLMDLVIAACGVYILYVWYLLKFKGEIKENILLPKDVPVKRCKDKAGYVAEMELDRTSLNMQKPYWRIC